MNESLSLSLSLTLAQVLLTAAGPKHGDNRDICLEGGPTPLTRSAVLKRIKRSTFWGFVWQCEAGAASPDIMSAHDLAALLEEDWVDNTEAALAFWPQVLTPRERVLWARLAGLGEYLPLDAAEDIACDELAFWLSFASRQDAHPAHGLLGDQAVCYDAARWLHHYLLHTDAYFVCADGSIIRRQAGVPLGVFEHVRILPNGTYTVRQNLAGIAMLDVWLSADITWNATGEFWAQVVRHDANQIFKLAL
jgi:hypothetical protein